MQLYIFLALVSALIDWLIGCLCIFFSFVLCLDWLIDWLVCLDVIAHLFLHRWCTFMRAKHEIWLPRLKKKIKVKDEWVEWREQGFRKMEEKTNYQPLKFPNCEPPAMALVFFWTVSLLDAASSSSSVDFRLKKFFLKKFISFPFFPEEPCSSNSYAFLIYFPTVGSWASRSSVIFLLAVSRSVTSRRSSSSAAVTLAFRSASSAFSTSAYGSWNTSTFRILMS